MVMDSVCQKSETDSWGVKGAGGVNEVGSNLTPFPGSSTPIGMRIYLEWASTLLSSLSLSSSPISAAAPDHLDTFFMAVLVKGDQRPFGGLAGNQSDRWVGGTGGRLFIPSLSPLPLLYQLCDSSRTSVHAIHDIIGVVASNAAAARTNGQTVSLEELGSGLRPHASFLEPSRCLLRCDFSLR